MGRILVILVLILVLYYMIRTLFRPRTDRSSPPRSHREMPGEGEVLVKDPCCQTYVPVKSALQARISGRDLFFCSQECMNRYIKEKEKKASSPG